MAGKNIKIGVLSDTHLNRVTKEFRDIFDAYLSDKDIILHAGDLVSIDVMEFFSRKDFHGVCGNMDPFEIREVLPEKKVIELEHYRIGLIHGWGSSADLEVRIWPKFQNVDVIVYGHSHTSANHMKEGVLLFNPGTATGFSYSSVQSIGILEVDDDRIHGEIVRI